MQPPRGETFAVRGRVFDGAHFLPDGVVEVRDGLIERVREGLGFDGSATVFPDSFVVPGFIDIHIHGALGADFADGAPTSPGKIARRLVSRGTTGFVATLVSSAWPAVQASLVELAAFREADPLRAALLGVHFEGPFLSAHARGAHAEENLQSASLALADRYLELVPRGLFRSFTLAPELEGGQELIRHLVEAKAFVALGHSQATYRQTLEALALGVSHGTHLFNAMAPVHHREPGIAGAFLDSPGATVELIPDGIHIHPALLRLVTRLKGPEGVAVVTDAAPVAGLPAGRYSWQGRELTLKDGGAYLPGGTLAGSLIDVPAALRVLVSAGVSLETAIRMATETPARITGTWPARGSLTPGKRADIVVLGPGLNVERTYLAGAQVFP